MGGGGFLGLGPAPSAPAAPDYTAAAQQTAQGNLDAARQATAANRVNQVTPYGNLDYSISGQDPYGNPTWTATQSLSPDQQQLYQQQMQTSLGLGNLQNQGLGYVQNMLSKPFDTSTLPQSGINPGETMQDSVLRRLQPQIAQQREMTTAQLANQGIVPGTTAYENAMRMQNQKENDLLTSAVIQGTNTGLAANQQAFGQAGYIRNEPVNTLNAIRSGSQVTNPQYVNPAQQATTTGPDYLTASQAQGQYALGASNAGQAAQSGFNQGLMGLGGTLGAAYMSSDIRMKENIKEIGVLANGLPVYEYEYKPQFKNGKFAGHGKFVGVMAHEVEQVIPQAVKTLNDGYKVVDYGLL
jgi:hypothetical protein